MSLTNGRPTCTICAWEGIYLDAAWGGTAPSKSVHHLCTTHFVLYSRKYKNIYRLTERRIKYLQSGSELTYYDWLKATGETRV